MLPKEEINGRCPCFPPMAAIKIVLIKAILEV